MNVDTPFHHSFVPQGALDISDAEDVENSLDDNIDVSEHDGHLIQLEPLALEHFLVELPFAPSCESAGPPSAAASTSTSSIEAKTPTAVKSRSTLFMLP